MWNDDYKIGIENIDVEHQYIFSKINLIRRLKETNKLSTENIFNALLDLKEYTIIHFSEEEEYMKEINYPKYTEHCAIHRSLENILDQRIQEIIRFPEYFSVDEFISFISMWWSFHICNQDRKIAAYKSKLKIS